jgi:hypothetical protein
MGISGIVNEEQAAPDLPPSRVLGRRDRQIHRGENLYPYKFVMSRILTDMCVTLNSALVNNVFIILGETVDAP